VGGNMTKLIKCNKCGKILKEDDLRAEVRFEGNIMVREQEDYCLDCWEESSLESEE
jgi:hypothetical protein